MIAKVFSVYCCLLHFGFFIPLNAQEAIKPEKRWNRVQFLRNGKMKKNKIFNSIHGQMNIGHYNGIVPFALDSLRPSNYFKSEGNLSLKIVSIPIQASFSVSNINSNYGLNNYFRLSFDYQSYINSVKTEVADRAKAFSNTSYWTELAQKNADAAVIKQSTRFNPSFLNRLSNERDSLELLKANWDSDSTLDSLGLSEWKSRFHSIDDANVRFNTIKNTLKDFEQSKKEVIHQKLIADSLMQKKRELEKLSPNEIVFSNPFLRNLQYLKKFEVGLVYPSYCTFTLNGIPINGINTEIQKGQGFCAFSYGTTAFNPLQVNSSLDQPFGLKNLHNFFDFAPTSFGRRILNMKIGKGKLDAEHVFFGFLYANGTAATTFHFDNPTIPQQAKNWVGEVDIRKQLGKMNDIEFVYGNSNLQTAITFADSQWNNYQRIAPFYQSNAALIRWSGGFQRTKTKWIITGRYVDPFFKSLGIGFIRSDHVRGEFKIDQAISDRLKFSGFYRRDQDNLLGILPFQVILQTAGATVQWKPKSNTSFRLNISPFTQSANSLEPFFNLRNRNLITTFHATHFSKKLDNPLKSISLVYSYYRIGNGGNDYALQNINLNAVFGNRKWGNINISGNGFFNSESLLQQIGFIEMNYSNSLKKQLLYNIAFRSTYSMENGYKYGYLASTVYQYNRYFSIEARIEKLLINNYYSLFNPSLLNRFPYSESIRLLCKF